MLPNEMRISCRGSTYRPRESTLPLTGFWESDAGAERRPNRPVGCMRGLGLSGTSDRQSNLLRSDLALVHEFYELLPVRPVLGPKLRPNYLFEVEDLGFAPRFKALQALYPSLKVRYAARCRRSLRRPCYPFPPVRPAF